MTGGALRRAAASLRSTFLGVPRSVAYVGTIVRRVDLPRRATSVGVSPLQENLGHLEPLRLISKERPLLIPSRLLAS